MDKDLIKDIEGGQRDKRNLAENIKHIILEPKDKFKIEIDKYNEYIEGVLIMDMSTPELNAKGLTVLHVLANKTVEFALHLHEGQSQTIYVIRGAIIDLINNIRFENGQSYFVTKNQNHQIRYFENTELLIVYMPSLKEITDKLML